MDSAEQAELLCGQCKLYRLCWRCKEKFCPHYSSKIDFRYCQYCFNDFIMEDTVIKKVIETKSLSGKKTFYIPKKARLIVFKGEAWMFAQQRVLDMTEEELATSIEYHRELFDRMLDEKEARKIAKNKANLAKMIKHSSMKIPVVGKGVNTDGTIIGTDTTTITETKVKRTTISAVQTNSAQVAMQAIVAMLKAKGLSEDQIKTAILAMATKK